MPIRLLPSDDLVRTGPVDHADWNHRFLLGTISRRRHALCLKLLRGLPQGRCLEIGYGSGVFMPELARHSAELHGIDVHAHTSEVAAALRKFGVSANLQQASAEAMPYESASFDTVIAVSSLEFIPDIASAAAEISRILKPTGRLIAIMPGHSPLADWGLRVLTGKRAQDDYANRRELVMPALQQHFTIERRVTFPPILGSLICLYQGLRLARR